MDGVVCFFVTVYFVFCSDRIDFLITLWAYYIGLFRLVKRYILNIGLNGLYIGSILGFVKKATIRYYEQRGEKQ